MRFVLVSDNELALVKSEKVKAFVYSLGGRYHTGIPFRHQAYAENLMRQVKEKTIAKLTETNIPNNNSIMLLQQEATLYISPLLLV